MDIQFDDLIRSASAARKQAYAPYSGFAVGAAVQCKSGAVFVGSNIENISYGLTICAERIAVASAVAAGEREFVAIAVVAGGQKIENLSHLLPDPKRGILENVHTH